MTVDFDGSREDCPLLADLSEVLERLESDSLEMLSMASQGRFIEFCKQTADEWSEKLQTVDSVLQAGSMAAACSALATCLGTARTDLFYERKKYGFKSR